MDDKQLKAKMDNLRNSINRMPPRTNKSAIMQKIEQGNSKQNHSKIWMYIGSFASLVIISVLILSSMNGFFLGDGDQLASDTVAEEDIMTTIEAVLERQFTGPDKELIELLNSPENMSVIGKEEESTAGDEDKTTELETYLKETYRAYFTESMYQDFIGKYAMGYQTSAHEGGYRLEVANIDIEQSENNENIYHFSVKVQYQKESNEQKATEVKGYAHMKDDKIGNIEYLDDGGLSKTLKAGS